MMGDWVYNTHNKQYEQVRAIEETRVMLAYNDLYDYTDIQPIPLTEEILENNGFKKGELCMAMSPHPTISFTLDNRNYYLEIWLDLSNNKFNKMGSEWEEFEIQYVHELQHALKLYKIEKEINC